MQLMKRPRLSARSKAAPCLSHSTCLFQLSASMKCDVLHPKSTSKDCSIQMWIMFSKSLQVAQI